jgi:hypothetical protein
VGGSTCYDNSQQACWTVSGPPTTRNTTKSKRFLLAHLHLEHVSLESTKADIRDSLENLTSNLPVEYDRNFERIVGSPARSKFALRVFSWLLAAQRPLNVEELREALAIGLEDGRLRKDRKPSKAIILDSCLGLIRLNNVSNTVEFFHFTAKEHILSQKEMQGSPPMDIPQSCLAYLKFKDFSAPCNDHVSIMERRYQYPFYGYVSKFWNYHVREAPEEQLKNSIMEFFMSENVFSSLQLMPPDARNARLIGRELDNRLFTQQTKEMAAYLCVYFELGDTLRILLEEKVSPKMRAPWGEHYSSLHVAVCYGHPYILGMLLKAGGDPNIQVSVFSEHIFL